MRDQSPLRSAVVGCGWIGSEVADDPLADGIQSHAAAYSNCSGTTLVGVCDSDPIRADRAARRWGLPQGFTNLTQLLAQVRPQIVSVCTPDATHSAVLKEVLQTPDLLAVIAEKPLALNGSEAREIVNLATRREVLLAVNYLRRFSASHIEARRRIVAGELGRILSVEGRYTKGVMHNGTHWFDLARWLIGDIVKVHAWTNDMKSERPDPTCHVRMLFRDGQNGFLTGVDEEYFTVFEMDIVGTEGRLQIGESGMRFTWSSVTPSPYYSGYRILTAKAAVAGGFKDVSLHMVENVVAALRSGVRPLCTGEDGLAALAVAEAARASLISGIEVAVNGDSWQ